MTTKEKWLLIGFTVCGIAIMFIVAGAYTQNAMASDEVLIAVTGNDARDVHACCAKLRGSMHPAILHSEQIGIIHLDWFNQEP